MPEQTRERDYVAHQQHLARRAKRRTVAKRYTRKRKHPHREDS